jgi:hypothetical protein
MHMLNAYVCEAIDSLYIYVATLSWKANILNVQNDM